MEEHLKVQLNLQKGTHTSQNKASNEISELHVRLLMPLMLSVLLPPTYSACSLVDKNSNSKYSCTPVCPHQFLTADNILFIHLYFSQK